MSKYKIEIINNTECKEYFELESLIKEFASSVFMAQNINLKVQTKSEKEKAVNNYEKYLSKEQLNKLDLDVTAQ